MKIALLAAALSALLSLPALADQITLTRNGDSFSVHASIADFDGQFEVDSGSSVTTMDAGLLAEMALNGKAHLTAIAPFNTADGNTVMDPVYTVDSITLGNCHIRGPLAISGGPPGLFLLGENVLTKIGPWSFSKDTAFLFTCPLNAVAPKKEASKSHFFGWHRLATRSLQSGGPETLPNPHPEGCVATLSAEPKRLDADDGVNAELLAREWMKCADTIKPIGVRDEENLRSAYVTIYGLWHESALIFVSRNDKLIARADVHNAYTILVEMADLSLKFQDNDLAQFVTDESIRLAKFAEATGTQEDSPQ